MTAFQFIGLGGPFGTFLKLAGGIILCKVMCSFTIHFFEKMAIIKDEYIYGHHKTSVNNYALLGNLDAPRLMDVDIIP